MPTYWQTLAAVLGVFLAGTVVVSAFSHLFRGYSNCLIAAIVIRYRTGGRLRWWPPWRGGFKGSFLNPWGHFGVELPCGNVLSYCAIDKKLPPWKQLLFRGYIKRTRPKN